MKLFPTLIGLLPSWAVTICYGAIVQTPTFYTVTPVSGITATANVANLNDHGLVTIGGQIWDRGRIEVVPGTIQDLNNNGQAVGGVFLDGNVRPFFWENGTVTMLGPVPGGTTVGVARSINDAGQIVGDLNISQSVTISRGVLWDGPTSTPVSLGTVGTDGASRGYVVNELGQAVGISMPAVGAAFGHDLFVWQAGSIAVSWETTISEVTGINSNGTIIGFGADDYFRIMNGVYDPVPPILGASAVTFRALNDAEMIVGTAFFPEGFSHREEAVLWNGEKWVQLDSVLATTDGQELPNLEQAWDINGLGQILVRDDSRRWFILTPIPEPRTAILLVIGLLTVLTARSRRSAAR